MQKARLVLTQSKTPSIFLDDTDYGWLWFLKLDMPSHRNVVCEKCCENFRRLVSSSFRVIGTACKRQWCHESNGVRKINFFLLHWEDFSHFLFVVQWNVLKLVSQWIIFGRRSKPKPTFRIYFHWSPAIAFVEAFSLVPLFARLTLKSQRLEICSAPLACSFQNQKPCKEAAKIFYSRKIFIKFVKKKKEKEEKKICSQQYF